LIKKGALRDYSIPKLRVTQDERKQVEKMANSLGMTLSDFQRHCLNKEINKMKEDD